MDNRSLSHTRWKCQYHIVFIPKYRKKVLYGKVREDVREIISTLCKYKNVEIIAGEVCVDQRAGGRIKERGFKKYRFISEPVTMLVTLPFGASNNAAPLEGHYQTTS